MSNPSSLVIGLDADDTLWDNESHFAATEERFRELAEQWVGRDEADARLLATERANLHPYGYGAKAFALSMVESIIEISGGEVTSAQIGQIVGWGKDLLAVTPELLPGVVETVRVLTDRHRIIIITKGDSHHQHQRVTASGLDVLVDGVEVVPEKDTGTYRRVLGTYGVDATNFVMVGNSIPSDILPVRALGARAIHIPFHTTWALEQADPNIEIDWITAESITEVPDIIERIEKDETAVPQ